MVIVDINDNDITGQLASLKAFEMSRLAFQDKLINKSYFISGSYKR